MIENKDTAMTETPEPNQEFVDALRAASIALALSNLDNEKLRKEKEQLLCDLKAARAERNALMLLLTA